MKYYWAKYEVITTVSYSPNWVNGGGSGASDGYPGYEIRSGKFYSTGVYEHYDYDNRPVGRTLYSYANGSDIIYKFVFTAYDKATVYNGTITRTSSNSRGNLIQSNVIAEEGTYPTDGISGGYWYVRGGLANQSPTTTLNTVNNITLYENDSLVIDGQATDADSGNIVNVKYQINGGTTRALATGISTGTNKITFNKSLTFKAGKLYDGETALTDTLAEGTAHQLKVWAEDDQGGKSTEQIRSFYVVPNRPPALKIDEVKPSGIIDSDKFMISGSCGDPDGNEVLVTYKINGGLAKEIYRGKGAAWDFEVTLKELKVGENAIVVEVTDSYNFKFSKTIKLIKNEVKTPILQSIARYKVMPPSGSAKGIFLWIQHQKGLGVGAEISMTLQNEQERFVEMDYKKDEEENPTNTTPIPNTDLVETEFFYETVELKENIVLKLKLSRESADISDSITLISGVLS